MNGRKQFCAPGKYGETVAAKTEGAGCKDCNAGRYQIARGQTSCTKCEAGLYSNKNKQTGLAGVATLAERLAGVALAKSCG